MTPWQWRQALPADPAYDIDVLAAALDALLRRLGPAAGRLWPNLQFHRPTPSGRRDTTPTLDWNPGTSPQLADSFLDFSG
ncbi:MAG TPA: hypothetical protein VFY84_04885 [Jiangellales bacterium]|nr:hypothetical protein [Jiangellales bacterium]